MFKSSSFYFLIKSIQSSLQTENNIEILKYIQSKHVFLRRIMYYTVNNDVKSFESEHNFR